MEKYGIRRYDDMSVQYQDRRARDLIELAKIRINAYRKFNNIDWKYSV